MSQKSAQSNPFTDFISQSDFSKLFENFKTMPFELKDFLETQRKNAQALTEAQEVAFENIQTIAQRQTEILRQMVEDHSNLARELLTEGTPEEKISKNADAFKTAYERTVKSMKELSDIIKESNDEASEIINKRVSATLTEIKSALAKTTSSKKKAA
ncbi:MAG: phasin family protein [Alphaproteobacteria bacterium]|nr:phasin family protein [Alphaproteobacteria bacterium]